MRYWWNRFGPMLAAEIRSVHNHFSMERHLQDRNTYKQTRAAALAELRDLLAS